jgi:hypothetical protein
LPGSSAADPRGVPWRGRTSPLRRGGVGEPIVLAVIDALFISLKNFLRRSSN